VALWEAGIGGNRIDHVIALVNQFVPDSHTAKKFSDADYRAAVRAGMILQQARERPLHERAFAAPYERVVNALVHLLETSQLDARERVEAGNVLARLGDPRTGVSVNDNGLPDLLFCEIPPGDFIIGDTLDDWGGKKEITYTKIKQPYYITRYPITNAQFDAFLNADDGFKNSDWWKDLAQTDNQTFPPKQGGVFDLPNHPVVNVTWYQAVAFCQWVKWRLETGDSNLQLWTPDGIKTTNLQSLVSNLQSPVSNL
jgi:hypothetical protein